MRNQQGFTLVEAVIVVAIIAILAAWAVPSFMDLRNRMALRSVGQDFMSSLAEARFDATKRGQVVTLDFTNTTNRLPARVSVVGNTAIGVSSGTTGRVRIEPRLGLLVNAADAGNYEMEAGAYRIRFVLSAVAQGSLCAPDGYLNPGVPAC